MVRVHQLIGITDFVRIRARERFSLTEARTCTIYNGVDVHRFRPPDKPVRAETPFRILTVASLIPEKGVDVLLRAAANLPLAEWKLAIAGEGPEENALKRLAGHLGIDSRTKFLGLRDDVPELLRHADVFVHPAIWQEALGNTVLEGMASGRPVVASRVGGIPELAVDEQEALLVAPGDSEALCEVLTALAQGPELRTRLGRAARARAVQDFSLERSIARHLDCCEAAAAGSLFA
jgi:glycosyltransferase involved in cell wall biosynthesis